MAIKKFFVAFTTLGILIAAGVLMFILIKTKPETPKRPIKQTTLGVKTDVAKHEDYTIKIKYPGRVAARNMMNLLSEVDGMILAGDVNLKVGESFKKGDILVRIFNEDERAAHKANISKFITSLSQSLPDIKIDFPEEFDKWFTFFTKIDLDKKLPELPKIKSNKEKVYLSSKDIVALYYNLKYKEYFLDRYTIRAPFNGAYTSVSKELGAITTTNGEIAKIISTDMLELIVGVSLSDAQILKTGKELDIISTTGRKYKGIVDRIAPFVDKYAQRINVYIKFKEPSLEIVEGQLLDITLPSKTLQNVIEIDREAVVNNNAIYCIKEGKLQRQIIEPIAVSEKKVYFRGISDGVRFAGESIVTPYDGMPVKTLTMDGKLLPSKQ